MPRKKPGILGAMLIAACSLGCEEDPAAASKRAFASTKGVVGGLVAAPASLVSDNAASLIGNTASAFRVQALKEIPVSKAKVEFLDSTGKVVATAVTGPSGRYSATLAGSGALQIRVTFSAEGKPIQELTFARPGAATVEAPVSAASTLAAAKALKQLGDAGIDRLDPIKYSALVSAVAAVLAEASATTLASTDASAAGFDVLAEAAPTLADRLNASITPAAPAGGTGAGGNVSGG